MSEFVFEAVVNVGPDEHETVEVQASSVWDAVKLLEAKYGYKSVIGQPTVKTVLN